MFSVKFCLLFLSVLASLAVSYIIEKTPADGTWANVLESKEKTYYIPLTMVLNVTAAKKLCEEKNLRLLTIESKEEHTRFINILQDEVEYLLESFWTAGTRIQGHKVLDHWIWETTQEKITFFDWQSRYPQDQKDLDCIQIFINEYRNGTWINEFCETYDAYAFAICESY